MKSIMIALIALGVAQYTLQRESQISNIEHTKYHLSSKK
jgi:hypothetical protein